MARWCAVPERVGQFTDLPIRRFTDLPDCPTADHGALTPNIDRRPPSMDKQKIGVARPS